VVSKIIDHCPLHRLHRIYARSGVTIPVSTMSEWMGEVADRLQPLADRLAVRILAAYIDPTAATGVKVLDPASPQNIERGTMWCYVGDEIDAVFRYTRTGEGATGPWEFLAGREGYVQADAASVFDRAFNGRAASAIEVGCWSHGRSPRERTLYRQYFPIAVRFRRRRRAGQQRDQQLLQGVLRKFRDACPSQIPLNRKRDSKLRFDPIVQTEGHQRVEPMFRERNMAVELRAWNTHRSRHGAKDRFLYQRLAPVIICGKNSG
jgi:hypothetical protein